MKWFCLGSAAYFAIANNDFMCSTMFSLALYYMVNDRLLALEEAAKARAAHKAS